MDEAEAQERVIHAVDSLLRLDAQLLELNANERSITHRLAVHLTAEFPGWHVDCEYNRDGHAPKQLSLPTRIDITSEDEHARTVFPDIIVHQRGSRENLVVIEAKKTTNLDGPEWDQVKLRAFAAAHQLGYKVAVLAVLETRPSRVTAVDLLFNNGRTVRRTRASSP